MPSHASGINLSALAVLTREGMERVGMSDAVSLATMSGPMMGAAFKFLFDRAGVVLDRRRTGKEERLADISDSSTETVGRDVSVNNLKRALGVLEIYRDHNLVLSPDDEKLVAHLEIVLAELQQIEGRPIDIAAIARAGATVEVETEEVEGKVTGLAVGEVSESGRADVVVRAKTVKSGGELTGMVIERRLG
ncbi:hypothetical protein [Amycolatopsis sp. WGS_07]|uniref:hypothetical protein n=1 Tax=Amycolatopsis sp. WGS_07 TaxID=3076764 RepID=UPI0038733FE3